MKNRSLTSSADHRGWVNAITKHSFQPLVAHAKVRVATASSLRLAFAVFPFTASYLPLSIASARASFRFLPLRPIANVRAIGLAASSKLFRPTAYAAGETRPNQGRCRRRRRWAQKLADRGCLAAPQSPSDCALDGSFARLLRRFAGSRHAVHILSGYFALYSHDEAEDAVLILAIRHQREAGDPTEPGK